MRIRAYYNEYIQPSVAENVDGNIRYREDDIPIMVHILSNEEVPKEIIKGLKDTEYNLVLRVENDVYDKAVNDIKAKDRVFIFGKEYRVLTVDTVVDNPKHLRKIARNSKLYDRYAKQIVAVK